MDEKQLEADMQLIELLEKNHDLLQTEASYQPEGDGYIQAYQHFTQLVKSNLN